VRVLVDANLFVSFLLHPDRDSAANQVVRAAVARRFELLLPGELLDELAARVSNKPYLARRVTRKELEELVAILLSAGEVTPRLQSPAPRVTRDAKDDYLLAHAVVGRADVLVTGDADLLQLEGVEDLSIVTADELLTLLNRLGAPQE
jgi:putative PIN family toxin of toxin-antitoxin system